MKKWEYVSKKVGLSISDLNKLGSQGWELVCHSTVVHPQTVVAVQYYVFKRELLS